MGLSASSVIPLLSRWEEYLNTHPNGDIEGFAQWVLAAAKKNSPEPPPSATAPNVLNTRIGPVAQSPLLISRLHRLLQSQAKPVAKELGFAKPLEFSVLIRTAAMKLPNKKQICQELLIESSTGVEIIKRLTQRGLIKEHPDAKDRRSALLSLTDKGKECLLEGFTKMNAAQSGFLAPLREEEQQQLTDLLSRLNDYHTLRLPLS